MFLFDTNHCFAYLEGAVELLPHLAQFPSSSVSTSVIVSGELKYMALKSERAIGNMMRVNSFLNSIRLHIIDAETAEIYGRLKNTALNAFGPKEKAKRRSFKIESLGFTDNDLWIAASALQHDEILLTTDHDFKRIASFSHLRLEQWVST